MRTDGLHHLAMVAADTARSTGFYRDILGLTAHRSAAGPEPEGQEGPEREAEPVVFGDAAARPGTLLTVTARPGAGQGRPGIGGIHHTALGVADEAGLLMWKRRLTDAGLAVSGPYDRGYFTSIYFRDPDGQILEIATAGPGYAIDEPVDRLGGELMVPPQRIVRGHRDEMAIRALTHPDPVPGITPAMELDGIHHVSGITDDLDRAGEFYEAALGLTLIKKTTNRDDPSQLHYFWAAFRDDAVAPHSSFTLFGWPPHWNRTRTGRGQTDYVAFRARHEEELGAWAEHLRGLGIETSPVSHGPAAPGLAFRAPDGLALRITVH